jgi:hypothetical protein
VKIAVDLQPLKGPFGGGNSFLSLLVEGLESRGHEVVFSLKSDDIGFILIMDPRWRHPMRAISIPSILTYLFRYPRTVVIHRINECDERKGTKTMNVKLRRINYLADITVFVSSWLRTLKLTNENLVHDDLPPEHKVILNGSDASLFWPNQKDTWKPGMKLRIVTHHWSSNPMKGTDLYLYLDSLLENEPWRSQFEFTYIGSWDQSRALKNTKIIPPLFGDNLARELRSHHVYITGSRNEPGGNHQNEGALSGLPLIYIQSGCLPEYCDGFGVELNESMNLEKALLELRRDYSRYRHRLESFPHTAKKMIAEYEALFRNAEERRESISRHRRLWRNPWTVFRLFFPM